MARGINKVILVGNLGADPETRYTANGNAVTNLSIATTDSWKDKQSGERQERTEWHRVVMFNRLAEISAEYLRKGSQVYLEGSLRTRKWQDNQGMDRYTTEIVANEMQMMGGRAGGMQADGAYDDTPRRDNRSGAGAAAPTQAPAQSQAAPAQSAAGGDQGFDDDIPF